MRKECLVCPKTPYSYQKMETNAPQLPNIALTLVPDSSQVHGYGYDEGTKTLAVEFSGTHHEATYYYFDVPLATAQGLEAAKSKGVYINRTIKAHFEYRRQEKAQVKEVI